MGVLTVTLEKVLNIRDKDGMGRSDPYVMFELNKKRLGFDRTFEKHESSRKSNTCNPEFNETFTFVDVEDLNEMELIVKVMDDDIGKDDCLGKVEIDLEFENLSGSPKEIVAVIDPKRFKIFSEEATIHLQLAFE
jgi:Ca2+-dependent lipid-binding protein